MMRCVDRTRVCRELPLEMVRKKTNPQSQEDVAAEREENAPLKAAIEKLPLRLRRVVNTVYGQDIRQRELARRCGTSNVDS